MKKRKKRSSKTRHIQFWYNKRATSNSDNIEVTSIIENRKKGNDQNKTLMQNYL